MPLKTSSYVKLQEIRKNVRVPLLNVRYDPYYVLGCTTHLLEI